MSLSYFQIGSELFSFVHRDIRISFSVTELMTMCDHRKKTKMMMKISGA